MRMKLKFKVQPYQTDAVDSVVDCFAGQPFNTGTSYRIDPGKRTQYTTEETGFKNSDLLLTDSQLLENIHVVQRNQNLNLSEKVIAASGARVNLDIEMETGTGKTYCYIKTMFELNKRLWGGTSLSSWFPASPSARAFFILSRLRLTTFTESYGKKARFFIYNSKQLAPSGKLLIGRWHQRHGDQHSGL
jgi:type III restriction enzyme